VPSFVLALCHEGAESALKRDASAQGLRPAFQTKGLVTLKHDDELPPTTRVRSALARFSALSLGHATLDEARVRARAEGAVLHQVTSIAELATRGARPKRGQRVLTHLNVGEKGWLTLHVHDEGRSGFPGEIAPIVMPEAAPSRAWLKIEEAIARFDLSIGKGARVLEIGAAPGGASWALLERGASVVGLDPNEMDPRVAGHARFTHVRGASTALGPADVAGAFDWLLLDVNVPPGTALRGAVPFLRAHERTLRGAVLTLKLGRWDHIEELPSWLGRIRRALPRSRVLPWNGWHHAQEIGVLVTRDL
jgi:23S rRNA (cytidine2498-2'-O)-methyltransferase